MTPPVAEFVGPTGWDDPSPDEFPTIARIARITTLDLGEIERRPDTIGTTGSADADTAVELAARGASLIGIVGTPFGRAGPTPEERSLTGMNGSPNAAAFGWSAPSPGSSTGSSTAAHAGSATPPCTATATGAPGGGGSSRGRATS